MSRDVFFTTLLDLLVGCFFVPLMLLAFIVTAPIWLPIVLIIKAIEMGREVREDFKL